MNKSLINIIQIVLFTSIFAGGFFFVLQTTKHEDETRTARNEDDSNVAPALTEETPSTTVRETDEEQKTADSQSAQPVGTKTVTQGNVGTVGEETTPKATNAASQDPASDAEMQEYYEKLNAYNSSILQVTVPEFAFVDVNLGESNSSLEPGDTNVHFATLRLLWNLPDAHLTKIQFLVWDSGASGVYPWQYLDKIMLKHEGKTVGSLDVSNSFTWTPHDSSGDINYWILLFKDLKVLMSEGEEVEIKLYASAPSSLRINANHSYTPISYGVRMTIPTYNLAGESINGNNGKYKYYSINYNSGTKQNDVLLDVDNPYSDETY